MEWCLESEVCIFPTTEKHTDSGMQKITLTQWADLIQKFLIGQLEVSTMGDGSINFIHLASKDSNMKKKTGR